MADAPVAASLSVVIIARDEARHIGAALASAAPVADELLVLLDPRTTDGTAAIAVQAGATVVESRFESFPAQRNRALELARGAWVLFLDADERLTEDLARELAALKRDWHSGPPAAHGYWIPRHNLYWGRALRGGGWYPDHQLRLLHRASAYYDAARLVHELVVLDGPQAYLQGHLRHINIERWSELRLKQRAYARAEARTLLAAGQRARPHNLVLQPLREVRRRWWTWRGYRDGLLGVTLALVMGWYELVKYVDLWRMQRRQGTQ